MSVLGPAVIKQQLQYLSDEDDDAADVALEPLKVLNVYWWKSRNDDVDRLNWSIKSFV